MDNKELEKLFLPVFEKHEIAAHKIRFISGKPGTLEVMIRKADGSMDMDTCALVSRDLSKLLDEMDFSDSAYNLDVCSFGAERELTIAELDELAGTYIHVELKNPTKGLDQLEGTLTGSDEENITVEYMDKTRKKTAEIRKDNIRFVRIAVKL